MTETYSGKPADRADAVPAGSPWPRSETALIALLGGGALLLITAGSLDRLNEVTFGGWTAKFGLSPQQQAQVASAVASRAEQQHVSDPEKVRAATLRALYLAWLQNMQAAPSEPSGEGARAAAAPRWPIRRPYVRRRPASPAPPERAEPEAAPTPSAAAALSPREEWNAIADAALTSVSYLEDDEFESDAASGDFEPYYAGETRDMSRPAHPAPPSFLVRYHGRPDPDRWLMLAAGEELNWHEEAGAHRAAVAVLRHALRGTPSREQIEAFAKLLQDESKETDLWSLTRTRVQEWLDEFSSDAQTLGSVDE